MEPFSAGFKVLNRIDELPESPIREQLSVHVPFTVLHSRISGLTWNLSSSSSASRDAAGNME